MMKTFTRIVNLLLIVFAAFLTKEVSAQSVIDPSDPVVTYSSSNPPTQPAWGTIGKWVRTKRVSWSTTNYKCYIYNGMAFRVRFPKSYNPTAVDGKKYPVLIFFHGAGEAGPVTDNEYQLFHGGQLFDQAVSNGKFDGYIFAMQTTTGFWGEPCYSNIRDIMNYMITNNKVDPFHITINGLSSGGAGTWDFAIGYSNMVAASVPMSQSSLAYLQSAPANLKWLPTWLIQGGLDQAPDPSTTQQQVDAMNAVGCNLRYTIFPNDGHDTWDDTWAQPDFWPFLNNSYVSNPWALFGRTQFCPGDPINITVGVTQGMQAYQWRKDSVMLPNTTNSINVTQLGKYECRVQRGGIWSDWSHTPLVVSIKQPTVSPNITIPALTSNVIPALDTSHGVTLQVPTGYTSYVWQKVGSSTTIGTSNSIYVNTPGSYQVKVTEQFGCSSSFSTPYAVIDANGANKPSPAASLTVTTLTTTSLRLDWSVNPSQQFPQTGFEVYQATRSGGPYKIIALLGAAATNTTVTGLLPGAKYFYLVRAVNGSAAAGASNEANGTTASDVQPPTAPQNLTITGTTRNSVGLSWTASTDNVGVTSYDIYVNGVKSFSTTNTSFVVPNLTTGQNVALAVTARDFAKNISPFSNQVSAVAIATGLTYKYFNFDDAPANLLNYAGITPDGSGISTSGLSLTPRTQNTNYGFLWEGYLHVTQAGTYQFRLTSVDGSKLYLGSLNGTGSPYLFSATAIVSNDGVHSSRSATSNNVTLAVGTYPIAIAYFHGNSGSGSISLSWKTPGGFNFNNIANSQFNDATVNNGNAPAAPSGLTATTLAFNKIQLNWTDNSNNETAYEIWRSTSPGSGFTTVGIAPPGATSYIDATLSASTKYYYQVRSIGQFGQSDFASTQIEAYWALDNNFNDNTGNGLTLTGVASPTFDNTTKAEGTYSMKLNGTTQAATIPNTNSFLQTAFTQRTIAGWIQSSSNTGNRIVADIGGSDDGLALVLNNNTLIGAVASNNTRATISAAYTNTTTFSHVALVYKGDSLELYINGAKVASTYTLSFHSIGTTTSGSRLGQNNGNNAYNNNGAFFSGWMDGWMVYNMALDAAGVANLASGILPPQSNATTLALPAIPLAPTGLGAQGTSTASTVTLHWTDNATNEDTYQVFRSTNNNSNYLPLATLPANTTSFVDTGLFANGVYYYQVKAVNVGGSSAFSNEDSAHTQDHLPVLTPITAGQFMRYGTTLTLPVTATDVDIEALNISVSNLPGFGTFTPTGNGTGNIVFTPAQADLNVYNNIMVTVTDQHGGSVSQSFNLTVNDNFNPVIARPVANVSMNEKGTATVNLSATDQNATDVLTWSFTGLPGFATPTTNGGSAQLALAPGYADAGVYTVRARVDDGRNGFDSLSFTITVANVNLPTTKTYIHFSDGSAGTVGATPWNNTAAAPVQNLAFTNLKDQNGTVTGMTLTITSPWQNISLPNGTNTYGVNTGNNSGVYPDAITSSAYYTDGNTQTFRLSGLGSNKYNFTFFGSRGGVNDDRTTIYSVSGISGTSSVSLQCANNSQNTVSINNVQPNADGTVTITLQKGPSAPYGYINALVIEQQFDDHTVPAKPRDLAGQFVDNNHVALSWTAAAYNALSYQVYRATSATGPYTLLNPGATNPSQNSYNDSSVSQNATSFYYVTATNNYGVSPTSDTLTFTAPNLAPVITAIAPITVQATKTKTVTVTATDAGDVISLQAINLPGFVGFTDNGNGTGTLTLNPQTTDIGVYTATIRAIDNHGAISNAPLSITATVVNQRNVYINFNDGSAGQPAQGAPWNNMNSAPNAGVTLANLKDDSATNTGFGIRLVDGWTGANNVGPTTGNNSGVYPDNVMQSLYYDGSGSPRHINITGLASGGKYNVIFYAGRAGVNDNRITNYTIGSQTVSLNGASNTTRTVEIDNVTPDGSGNIAVTIMQDPGAPFTYLNAMQIQYSFDTTFYPPSNLTATGVNATSIRLNWLNNTPGATTGFEVWRSTSPTGTFSLLTTVSGTTTTYTNTGLTAGSNFFYEVRALKGVRQSAFSNIAGGSTVAYSVYVQMNDGSQNLAQGGIWNSINTLIFPGYELPNMIDSKSQPTGITLGQSTAFTGYNVFGATTGNNSGIYPDNVMQGFYYTNFGDTATLYLSNLNLTSTYNLTFFGSRANPTTPVLSTYQSQGQIVSLDATNNTSNTVQIIGLKPDSTGTIVFKVYNTNGGRAYLDALVIDGVPSAYSNIAQTPVATQEVHTAGRVGTAAGFSDSTQAALLATQVKTAVFPNPFIDDVNLSLQLPQPVSKLSVTLIDVMGRMISRQELRDLPQGTSTRKLSLGRALPAGNYFILLQGLPGDKPRVLQLVRSGR